MKVQVLGGSYLRLTITPLEAYEQIKYGKNVVFIDARSNLQQPDEGEALYKKEHIPGAYYVHLERDLSGEVKAYGGNHPLPNIDTFVAMLRSFGVDDDTRVIVYDDGANMFAPRALFLIYYFGHKRVALLDGGFSAWKQLGYPTSTEIPEKKNGNFIPNVKDELIVYMEDVKNRGEVTLIDSRAKERYEGKVEPLYVKAGHIPGAVNYFWEDVFHESGTLKQKDELEAHFTPLRKREEIIVSCGSGVSACANFIALKQCGYDRVKVYPGSFSDWISYPENEIETETNMKEE